MNQIIRFFAAVLVVFAVSSAVQAQPFEGTITLQVTAPQLGNKPMEVMTSMKGDKAVTEMNGPMGSMKVYIGVRPGKIVQVMSGMKMGMQMDVPPSSANDSLMAPVPVATGQHQTIAGYDCELYLIPMRDTSVKMKAWMTTGAAKMVMDGLRSAFTRSGRAMPGPMSSAFGKMFQKGLVPIKVESPMPDGSVSTVVFEKYETKSLDDSIFEIPSDIKINDMGAGMMGRPGMGGGQ